MKGSAERKKRNRMKRKSNGGERWPDGEKRNEKIEKIKFQIPTAFVKALDAEHFYKCHFT